MDKTARQYLDEIRKHLPEGVENRNQFLSDMKSAIENDAETQSDMAYMSLVKQFGDPKEITDDFLDMQDPGKLLKRKRTSDIRFLMLIPVSAILMLFLIRKPKSSK